MNVFDDVVRDIDGVIVAGAKVYIYSSAGTLASLFESDGTTPKDNPLVSDALGQVKAWLTDDGYYTAEYFWGGRKRYVRANVLLGSSPLQQVIDEGEAQIAAVNTAGTTQIAAVNSAGATQIALATAQATAAAASATAAAASVAATRQPFGVEAYNNGSALAQGIYNGDYNASGNFTVNRFTAIIEDATVGATADITVLVNGVAVYGPVTVTFGTELATTPSYSVPLGADDAYLIERMTGTVRKVYIRADGVPA